MIVFGTLVTLLFVPGEFREQLEFYGCSKTGTVVNYSTSYNNLHEYVTTYTITLKCKYGNQTISPFYEGKNFKVKVK